MKKVAIIKFCPANEARRRARLYDMEDSLREGTIYGIDEETYETFNNRRFDVIATFDNTISIEFDDERSEGMVWYVPKIFIDIREI